MIGWTCFGHCYAHHQELTTIVLITTLAVRFLGCCWLEVRCRQAGVVSGLQAIVCSPDTTPACQWASKQLAVETILDRVTNILIFLMHTYQDNINPLNAELNPTCQLLALLGAHHILHVSRIRANTSHWVFRLALTAFCLMIILL